MQIFNSENLKDWTYQSRVDGFFDCPELYELPLDGNPANTRWIVHCANLKYKVGRFDGKTFIAETGLIDGHKGKVGESAYSPQVFRNTTRPIQISWLYSDRADARQMMGFPCDLSLVTTPDGPRLRWEPVAEIARLYGNRYVHRDLTLRADEKPVEQHCGPYLDVKADIRPGDSKEVELDVRGTKFVYRTQAKELMVRGYTLPLALPNNRLQLRVLLDKGALEIFADDGLVYLPLTNWAQPMDTDSVTLSARGGTAQADVFEIREVNSIWSPDAGVEKSR